MFKNFKKWVSLLVLLLLIAAPVSAAQTVILGYADSAKQSNWSEYSEAGGQLRVSSQSYLTTIIEGNIPDHIFHTIEGKNDTVNTIGSVGEQVIWNVPPGTQAQYVYPSVAATVTAVSDDSTDNQAGVGARSILITGLLSGGAEGTETLLLHATDGTIAVTSVKLWYRINDIEVVTAGSSGKNAGNLIIKNGANILSYVEEGTNKALQAVYTVPLGKEFYVDNVRGTGAGTKNVDVHVYARESGGLFRQLKHRTINDSPFEMTTFKFPALTDIEGRAHADVNGGKCDISFEGWLEDE